jgi:ribonuclease HI
VITAAADGSSLSNPGPAGWAWYISDDCWAAGGWQLGTNNMGELMAVLDLLRQTREVPDLTILCDSQYAIKCCTEWLPAWKRRGWRKADGQPVLNQDLLKELDTELTGRRPPIFRWVKGHAGHALNERADALARAAAAAQRDGTPVAAGPGFAPGSVQAGSLAVVPSVRREPEPDLFSLDAAPADEVVVASQERRLWDDAVRLDRDAMSALLHPAFVSFEPTGDIRTRGSTLARAAALEGAVEVDILGVDRLGPDVILVRSRIRREGERLLSSSTWQRSGDTWQIRFRQSTRC